MKGKTCDLRTCKFGRKIKLKLALDVLGFKMKSEKWYCIYFRRNSKATLNIFSLIQDVKTKTTIEAREYFYDRNIARNYQMTLN